MLNLDSVNAFAQTFDLSDGHVNRFALQIEIEVFGQLGDESSLPESASAVQQAMLDALEDAKHLCVDSIASVECEVDGVMQRWSYSLCWFIDELERFRGESIDRPSDEPEVLLGWEFRVKRGAMGQGRWICTMQVDLSPPEFPIQQSAAS